MKILQNFELFVESKSGIGQLRSLIFELATTGKLTEHVSADGSGSELVKLIGEQKIASLSARNQVGDLGDFTSDFELPILPDNWAWSSLEDLGEINPRNQADDELEAGFVPMALISEEFSRPHDFAVRQWREIKKGYTHFQNGDVVLAKITPCFENGKAAVIDGMPKEVGAGTTELHVYRPVLMEPKFILAYLKSRLFVMNGIPKMTGTAGQKRLPTGYFRSFPVPVPPLQEQHRIVEALSELMSLCDQLEEAQKLRDQIEAAVRKSSAIAISIAQTPEEFQAAWERIQDNWDVIAGGPESVESLRELVLDVLFRPRNRDEWLTKSFGELLSLSNGDRSKNYPSKEHRVSTGIPFVNAGHLNNGRVNMSDMDYITREKYESLGGGKFKDGDVLFCLRGSLGKSALVRDVGEGAIASSLAILRVGGELDAEYLFWFLQSGMARVQIKNFDNGTAQPNLAAKNVLKFKLPLPSLNQQKNIVSRVGELIEICDQLEASMIGAESTAHRFARSVVLSP